MEEVPDIFEQDKKKRILLISLTFAIASMVGLYLKSSTYLTKILENKYAYTPFNMNYFSFIGSLLGVFLIQQFGLKIVTCISLVTFGIIIALYGIIWNIVWFNITEFLMQISFAFIRCIVYIVPCVLFGGSYSALYMCALHLFYNIGVFFGEPLVQYFESTDFMAHYDAFLFYTLLSIILFICTYYVDFRTISVIRSECSDYRLLKVIRDPITWVLGITMTTVFIINGTTMDYCIHYIQLNTLFNIQTWEIISDVIACASLLFFGYFADKIGHFIIMYVIYGTVIIVSVFCLLIPSICPYLMIILSFTVYLCLPIFFTCTMEIYKTDINIPISLIYVLGEFFYNILNDVFKWGLLNTQGSMIILIIISIIGLIGLLSSYYIHHKHSNDVAEELFQPMQLIDY